MAQALTKWMAAQSVRQFDGSVAPAFAGVWAIFGHGNVAGLGEALYAERDVLPTFRGHNEQGMAHAAIAYAKQMNRRRMMAVTSSIGPGATNMITAAALAHVNRLPVLFLPGDVFADRRPDPVLQQVEDFADGTVSANDCFRPVSRYFDRITRPEQLLQSLPKAMSVLTDPAACGPVTLSLCQDVQAESYEFPDRFFAPRIWEIRRQRPDEAEIAEAIAALKQAKRPLIIAGGGVRYSGASGALADFAAGAGIPVAATQAGKSVMPEAHPNYVGSLGVTGSTAANTLAAAADVVLSIGSRLQDFTTGSNGLIKGRIFALNVQLHDAIKHDAATVLGDALVGLEALAAGVDGYHMEYGFSCMGYEVAAGIGVHMAAPDRPNIVFAGDGSYLMMNSELATAVMMGTSMTLVITDNRGFGCINRLQAATGGAAFNNLLADSHHEVLPDIDFVAHAAALGARAEKAGSIAELEAMVAKAVRRDGVDVIVIDTDPGPSTEAGGTWWDVAVPAVSTRDTVTAAYKNYQTGRQRQDKGNK